MLAYHLQLCKISNLRINYSRNIQRVKTLSEIFSRFVQTILNNFGIRPETSSS